MDPESLLTEELRLALLRPGIFFSFDHDVELAAGTVLAELVFVQDE